MTSIFDSHFPFPFPMLLESSPSTLRKLARSSKGNYPRINMSNIDGALLVTAELPGLSREDIEVTFDGDYLVISGERTLEKDVDTQYAEITSGSYSRSIQIPPTVNKDAVSATYKDGMLRLTLPLKEEVKPKQIEIT